MVILGIDPGTATTGFGVIKTQKNKGLRPEVIDYGCILTSPKQTAGERLQIIHREILKLIKKYEPGALAIENVYFFKNLKTAMPVSEAKGVILLSAAQKKIPVYAFTPLQVKMTIAGYGRAEKKQVQKMIKILLGLKEIPKTDDAADALGIALCCSFQRNNKIKLS